MIDVERLKLMLRITTNDDDVLLIELTDHAVAFVSTYTNRHFGLAADRREYHIGLGGPLLPLRANIYDNMSAPSITVTEQRAPGLDVVVIDETAADGFELRTGPRNAWLVRAGGYVWKMGFEYLVDYTVGYDWDGLPGDVESVIVSLVGRRYHFIGSSGLKSETIGGYSYTRFTETDLEDDDRRALDAWREPVIA